MAWPWQKVLLERVAAEIVQRPVRFGAVEGGLVHQVRDHLARLRDLLLQLSDGPVGHAYLPPCSD